MTSLPRLRWRTCTTEDRKRLLPHFECTIPEGRWSALHQHRYHPRRWELRLQKAIRQLHGDPDRIVRLGFVGEELAVFASAHAESEAGYWLEALAVSRPWQGRGIGGQALSEFAAFLDRDADIYGMTRPVYLRGDAHVDNAASRGMLEGFGAEQVPRGAPGTQDLEPDHVRYMVILDL